MHSALIALLLLIPLYFTEGLNLTELTTTFLVAPPPPPPAPPPAVAVARAVERPTFIKEGTLTAPMVIPKKIAMVKEAPLPEAPSAGVTGGVAGGVPGGQLGGVLGGIIGAAPSLAPPPPPAERTKILRVGGEVRMPRLIYGPPPAYPTLARIGQIEGDVHIDAVIAPDGSITDAHVVDGPALLQRAALEAVRLRRYAPTLLDGTPVAVEARITITFVLTH
jgi:protein TonB